MSRIILPTDPPSLQARKAAPPMFDAAPHRNRGMTPCPVLSPGLMNRVIATAVAFGMPRREAEEARVNPFIRSHVAMLAVLIWDAAAGSVPARNALERIKFAFRNSKSVAEILAAEEQPPDSTELQALLGLD